MNENNTANYVDLAAGIVSAFVSNNSVPTSDLPALIASVHAALAKVGSGAEEQPKEELRPAVPIKKSITPDYVICLDTEKNSSRSSATCAAHMGSRQTSTARWDLPSDYPMVAPNYAKARSELATKMGLGQKRRAPARQRRKAA